MEITVKVELYTGSDKKTINVFLDDSDIRELAEIRASENNHCDSCQAKSIELTSSP